ncbi:ATP-binding protein [Candidatus Collierbacteria bacterium]|nr:ATP-binding protein [Candidatus Collierbacteria bacterium]
MARMEAGVSREVSQEEKERFGVLFNLVDIKGTKIALKLVEKIETGRIRRVIVFGEPGAGKTTLLQQLDYYLRSKFRDGIETSIFLFDHVLAFTEMPEAQDGLGMRYRTFWDEDEWNRFSKVYEDALQNDWESLRGQIGNTRNLPTRLVQMAELVVLGQKNRGRSAVEKLAREINLQQPETADTIFLALVAHPKTQLMTVDIRPQVLATEDSKVIDTLQRFYRIRVNFIRSDLDQEGKGRFIKQVVSRSAPNAGIVTLHKENIAVTREIAFQLKAEFNRLPILPGEDNLDLEPRIAYRLKAFYADWFMSVKLGLDKNVGWVGFNPHDEEGVVDWYFR